MTTEHKSKTCRSCGQSKPLTDFYKKGNGLDARCKTCVLKKKADVYQRTKIKRTRGWTRGNPLTEFTIEFIGLPNKRLLAHRLKLFEEGEKEA